MNKKSVAIYTRYSSQYLSDDAINTPVQACKEYAERQELAITDIYTDSVQADRNGTFAEFQRMLQDAKAGKFEVLLVHKFDHLGRDFVTIQQCKQELRLAGIKLIRISDSDLDSQLINFVDEMVDMINGFIAENEKRAS